jgi:DNA-binding NtrC family response regulator
MPLARDRARTAGVRPPPALVLIVEDEKILAESMSLYLEHYAYATIVAHAGEDGLRVAEQTSPDVALVDLRLPGIDGLEVLERLRRTSPATQVIVATAHASASVAAEASRRGALACLTKPVDLDALRALVETALAPPGPGIEADGAVDPSLPAPR